MRRVVFAVVLLAIGSLSLIVTASQQPPAPKVVDVEKLRDNLFVLIDLYYFGTGHTNGDAWVVFPALRVMDAGDDFGFKNLPRIDTLNHGSAMTFPDVLATAVRTVNNVDTVIPGHSTQMMTMNDLRELADFNREFLTLVREAKKAGKSVDDVANTWKMPGLYTGFDAVQPDRLKTNVQLIFDEAK